MRDCESYAQFRAGHVAHMSRDKFERLSAAQGAGVVRILRFEDKGISVEVTTEQGRPFEDDVDAFLRNIHPRSRKRAFLNLALQIQNLHERKVFHGDIKLSNIVLVGEELKLIDFEGTDQMRNDGLEKTDAVEFPKEADWFRFAVVLHRTFGNFVWVNTFTKTLLGEDFEFPVPSTYNAIDASVNPDFKNVRLNVDDAIELLRTMAEKDEQPDETTENAGLFPSTPDRKSKM